MTQSIIKQNKQTFGSQINAPAVRNLINETLGSELRGKRFVASITSAVSTNPTLKECDFNSIITGALVGEALGLNPSNQLGQYYLIPFNDKNRGKVAQFQIGWKGLYSMAMKTGEYKKIIVEVVKDGELIKFDRFNEEIEVIQIEDEDIREQTETIGYYATFELLNGFKKTIYWSKKKMKHHAELYSKGYNAHKGYTFWEKNFDEMGKKTILKQLLKYGVLSTEFASAYEKDQAVITSNENGEQQVDYIDNDINNEDEFSDVKAFMEQEKVNAETGEVQEQEELDFNSLA